MKYPSVRKGKKILGFVGVAAVVWWAGVAAAQPPRGPGGPPGAGRGPQTPGAPFGGFGGAPMFGGGSGMMGFGPTQLLNRQDVRRELELLDDQTKQLDALEQKTRERMREAFSRPPAPGQGGDREPRREPDAQGTRGVQRPRVDFRQVFEQVNKETRAEIEKILLPHQVKRLDQLSTQLRMQGGGMSLLSGGVARELGVTDEQREQLRTKVEEIEQETRKQEAELRRQSREKVIRLLTPEQQEKLKDMTGEPFTFEMEWPPQRRGGAGVPGQPPGGPRVPNRGDSRR